MLVIEMTSWINQVIFIYVECSSHYYTRLLIISALSEKIAHSTVYRHLTQQELAIQFPDERVQFIFGSEKWINFNFQARLTKVLVSIGRKFQLIFRFGIK